MFCVRVWFCCCCISAKSIRYLASRPVFGVSVWFSCCSVSAKSIRDLVFCVCVHSPRSLQDFSSRLPFCVQVFCVPCVGFPFVSRHCRFLFLCLGLSRPFLCWCFISFVWQVCLFLCLQTSRAFCAGLSPPCLCRFPPSVGSLPSFLRAVPL